MLPKLRVRPHLESNVPLPPLSPFTPSPVTVKSGTRECTSPWTLRGRNSRFSRHNPSFPDTSFSSLRRRTSSLSAQLHRFHTLRSEALQVLLSRNHKKLLASLLKRHYGVKFTLCELSSLTCDEMTLKAVHHRAFKYAQKAAVKLLNWFRVMKFRKGLMTQEARSHMAAVCIQIHWRKYRDTVLRPRETYKRRWAAAVCIQRIYRGYLTRQTLKKRFLSIQLTALESYFEGMRTRPLISKAPSLIRYWRKYKQRKEAETARKAALRHAGQYFSGLISEVCKPHTHPGDVFSTSSKAPPMRGNIDRPGGLAIGKTIRKMKSEEQPSPLTFNSASVRRNRRDLEPSTAPLKLVKRQSSRMEKIDEIS